MANARAAVFACLLTLGLAAQAEVPLVARGFTGMAGSTCPTAKGEVFIAQSGATAEEHALTIKMQNVPAGCSKVLPGLRCKAAVYTGSSCENAGSVMAKGALKYQTSISNAAGVQKLALKVAPLLDLVGKLLVVHDKNGTPCTCAKIEQLQLAGSELTATLGGGAGANGTIKVKSGGSGEQQHQVLFLDVSGAPAKCATAAVADPKCVVFVSSATSCTATCSSVKLRAHSGFKDLRYFPSNTGRVLTATSPAVTGQQLTSLKGKAVVLVDQAGEVAGCGIIGGSTSGGQCGKDGNGGSGNGNGNGGSGTNVNAGSQSSKTYGQATAAAALALLFLS